LVSVVANSAPLVALRTTQLRRTVTVSKSTK
jgi:hypothetical protein